MSGGRSVNIATLAQLPDWPARMTSDVAARYMCVSETKFKSLYGAHAVREGSNVLWAKVQLDRLIAKQFAIPQLAASAGERDDSWDDLR